MPAKSLKNMRRTTHHSYWKCMLQSGEWNTFLTTSRVKDFSYSPIINLWKNWVKYIPRHCTEYKKPCYISILKYIIVKVLRCPLIISVVMYWPSPMTQIRSSLNKTMTHNSPSFAHSYNLAKFHQQLRGENSLLDTAIDAS